MRIGLLKEGGNTRLCGESIESDISQNVNKLTMRASKK
jgi:hypothetical protein